MKIFTAKRFIKMIEEIDKTEYSSNQSPSTQLIPVLLSSGSPPSAANVAIKYCGNDAEKAIRVLVQLRDSEKINPNNAEFFTKVIEVLQTMITPKSSGEWM